MNRTLKLSVAASFAALLAMTNGASAAIIISDQTQLVTDKGTVELIVDQLSSNSYKATLIWSPTGYTGATTDYISNAAVKLTSDTTNESLLFGPLGTWELEVDTGSMQAASTASLFSPCWRPSAMPARASISPRLSRRRTRQRAGGSSNPALSVFQ